MMVDYHKCVMSFIITDCDDLLCFVLIGNFYTGDSKVGGYHTFELFSRIMDHQQGITQKYSFLTLSVGSCSPHTLGGGASTPIKIREGVVFNVAHYSYFTNESIFKSCSTK